jgi:hypothetical protein
MILLNAAESRELDGISQQEVRNPVVLAPQMALL